jgi:hypothetical protein
LIALWSVLAFADEQGVELRPLTWVTEGDEPGLRVDGFKGELVTATLRAKISNLEVEWMVTPTINTGAPIPLEVPAEAWMTELQLTYVTDIVAFVTVGGRLYVSSGAYLAWPTGPQTSAVLWDRATMQLLAPQGVLDPALRIPEFASVDRILPPAVDGVSPPSIGEGAEP